MTAPTQSPREVALDHYRDRQLLVTATLEVARQMWSEVDPRRISDSWATMLPEFTAVVAGAQLGAARPADSYVADALTAQGVDPDPTGSVAPEALSGVASDGRGLMSLLTNPIVVTLAAIGDGMDVARALGWGRTNLVMLAGTQVADAGRLADQIATTAHRGAGGYVRVAVGGSCSRCLILAGRVYKTSRSFDRHPLCDCVHLPAAIGKAGGLRQNPEAIYARMTPAERTRAGFTRADQLAIEDGADLAAVVNAHRGMYSAGGRKLTRESTTRRGVTGGRQRLSVDQIYRDAGDDRDEAVRLLQLHGYLRGVPARIRRDTLDLAAARPAPGATGLDAMTVVQLRAEAKRLGIKVPSKARKAEILELVKAGPAPTPVRIAASAEKLTVVQLRQLAKDNGIRISSKARKADVIAEIRAWETANGRQILPGGAAPSAVKAAKPPAKTTLKDLTRGDLESYRAEVELSKLRAKLRTIPTRDVAERRRVEQEINAAQARAQRLPGGAFNWASSWWDDVVGVRVSGGVPAARLKDHIEGAVSRHLPVPLRIELRDELVRQSARVPRTVLHLAAVRRLEEFDDLRHGQAMAYYRFSERDIHFHPDWYADRAGQDRACRLTLATDWWTPTGAPNNAAMVFAHEFGHHVAERLFGLASYEQLDTLAKVLDARLEAKGLILRELRDTQDLQFALKEYLIANSATARRLVSEYGTKSYHELMAEIWQEYSTHPTPRPHIKAIGDAIRRAAEGIEVVLS